MKPIRLALFLLLAACATGPTPTEDARKRFDEGRSDEALALLQKASREDPENSALRNSFYPPCGANSRLSSLSPRSTEVTRAPCPRIAVAYQQ